MVLYCFALAMFFRGNHELTFQMVVQKSMPFGFNELFALLLFVYVEIIIVIIIVIIRV